MSIHMPFGGAAAYNPSRPSAPAIKMEARHVDFFYGNKLALQDVSCPLHENQVTAFIGPSGCGKSTLLRIFNRIYALYPNQRAEGEVLLNGQNILAPDVDDMQLRARVGMVFQKPTPLPMSIFDNVALGVRVNEEINQADLEIRVEEALRQAALWDEVKDILNRSGFSLSGGQQQRLCIARTIAVKPDVVLLDEPCSALDPITTARIEVTIEQLKQHYTLAIVTHNLQQAARVSNYTGFMYLGEMVEFESTDDIFTRPKNKLTQNYLEGRFG